MFAEISQAANNGGNQIESEELPTAKVFFELAAEDPQEPHVEEDVGPEIAAAADAGAVVMQKGIGKQPPDFTVQNLVGVEYQEFSDRSGAPANDDAERTNGDAREQLQNVDADRDDQQPLAHLPADGEGIQITGAFFAVVIPVVNPHAGRSPRRCWP